MKNSIILFFATLSIGFTSCSKSSVPEGRTDKNIVQTVHFSVTDNSSAGASMSTSTLYSYYFKDSKMYKSESLTLNSTNEATLTAVGGTEVYFVSEFSLENEVVVGQTTQNEFLALTVGDRAEHNNNAPSFLSGKTTLNEGNSNQNVVLTRGVARLDINTKIDPLTSISRIVVKNAAGSTLAFAGNAVRESGTKKNYEQTFNPVFSGIKENVCQLYETNTPVEVEVYGFYDNIPILLKLEIPSVLRNKIYTIKVLNAGASIKSLFEVKEWEDGGTIEGKPDVATAIQIDEPLSNLASGVNIEPSGKEVHVSQQGGDFTLAFVSASQITLAQVEGKTADIEVTPHTTTQTTPQGVVTKIDLKIAAQGKGRLPYHVRLHLRNTLVEEVYDYIDVLVDGSKSQIETVRLGGVEWMAFHARSRNLEDQIYPLDGSSVEDMYRLSWIETVGGLFQWGRIYMYTPWLSGSNNQGGTTQNDPWKSDSHVPCPNGYRIPTRPEMHALLPNGLTIPGTYNYNGESVTTSLHTIPGTPYTPTNVGGRQRYVKFTSNVTGKTLIFPLSGFKGDKDRTPNPQFGQRLIIWTDDHRDATPGWAWTGEINFGNNETTTIRHNMTLQMEAFASVRCVKITN